MFPYVNSQFIPVPGFTQQVHLRDVAVSKQDQKDLLNLPYIVEL